MHIVFTTKFREPLIQPAFEQDLHNYPGGVCKNLECQPITIGGYYDHVRPIGNLSQTHPVKKKGTAKRVQLNVAGLRPALADNALSGLDEN